MRTQLDAVFTSLRYVANLVAALLFSVNVVSAIDTPLAGQIIADPVNPRRLVYHHDTNQDGRLDSFQLVAPGDPEGFLFLPASEQDKILNDLIQHGGNGLYLMAVRSHGGDGSAKENPFLERKPGALLDEAVLARWDTLLARMDEAAITAYFFIYDDNAHPFGESDDVSPDERAFVTALVTRYQHLRHLIWCVAEEYADALSRAKVEALAAVISEADGHAHVIAIHQATGDVTFDFAGSPNITQFALQSKATSPQALHRDVLAAQASAGETVSVNMAENWNGGKNDHSAAVKNHDRADIRRRNWAVAMAGSSVMVLGTWHPKIGREPTPEMLADMRTLQRFMESFNLGDFEPDDALAYGDTEWVLSNGDDRFILYSTQAAALGVKGLKSGSYALEWLDPLTGTKRLSEVIVAEPSDTAWPIPEGFSPECALHLRRL